MKLMKNYVIFEQFEENFAQFVDKIMNFDIDNRQQNTYNIIVTLVIVAKKQRGRQW